MRLTRQLKEYGDHNPELLRIVEAMGFLSLYTAELPRRLNDTLAQAQVQLATELKALHTTQLTALAATNGELQKNTGALHSARSLAERLSFPDADKIKATTESNAQTAKAIASAADAFSRRLRTVRLWHLGIIFVLAILYFAGGAWFVWNDHRNVQKTIYEHVAARTKDAIGRIQYLKDHFDAVKPFLDTGVRVSIARDSGSGDTVLFFEGTSGVSLYYPRYADGRYAINVLQ